MFREVHPRVSRAPVRVNEDGAGENQLNPTYPEEAFLRCSRCGFVMNSKRHSGGYREGITQESVGIVTYDGDIGADNGYDTSDMDPTYDGRTLLEPVSSSNGCPLCGTFMYR